MSGQMPRLDGGLSAAPDTALVQPARAGRAAFGLLYERDLDRLYAYLRARCTGDAAAADLTQQGFLHALDAVPR